VSGFGRDINYFITIRRLSICASLVASRKAGDGPSSNVSIIADDSDEVDPAGGASRRVGICLDIDVRRKKNYRILSRPSQTGIGDFSII
jgi:hypothetical protein